MKTRVTGSGSRPSTPRSPLFHINGTVRALWLEDRQLNLRDDVPRPDPPPGEALVRVLKAGICNTDVELTRGYHPFTGIPGHEFVGVVEGGSALLGGRRVVGEINAVCGTCRPWYRYDARRRRRPGRLRRGRRVHRQPGRLQYRPTCPAAAWYPRLEEHLRRRTHARRFGCGRERAHTRWLALRPLLCGTRAPGDATRRGRASDPRALSARSSGGGVRARTAGRGAEGARRSVRPAGGSVVSPAPSLFGRLNPSVEPAARLAAWRATVRRNRVAPLARRLCAALLPGRRAVSAGLRRRRSSRVLRRQLPFARSVRGGKSWRWRPRARRR